MKAIVMTAAGNPEVLQLQDLPKPHIATPTQVLVKLKAAGVNPIDTKLRQRGTFFPDQMPAILGCDGAGIIEEIGSAVEDFQVGDAVYFCAGGLGKKGTGNYAEWAAIESRRVVHKPQSLSFTEAAAAPLVLITAWEALYDRCNASAGQTILIHAGAGGVGHVAIQLAKLRGASVATTVSNLDKERLVRQLGADFPILYKQTDFATAVMNWTDGRGVDIAFDTIGGKTFYETCPAVRVYGDLVTILEPNFNEGSLKTARNRNLRLSLELMLTPALLGYEDALAHQADILRQCATWLDRGELKIHVSQTFPLEQATLAHRAVEKGNAIGKIVLVIS
jgi:NADPH2:quinone reductase